MKTEAQKAAQLVADLTLALTEMFQELNGISIPREVIVARARKEEYDWMKKIVLGAKEKAEATGSIESEEAQQVFMSELVKGATEWAKYLVERTTPKFNPQLN